MGLSTVLSDACDKVNLILTKIQGPSAEEWWQITNSSGAVNFSGTNQSVMTYVLGYQAAYMVASAERYKMKKAVLDAIK